MITLRDRIHSIAKVTLLIHINDLSAQLGGVSHDTIELHTNRLRSEGVNIILHHSGYIKYNPGLLERLIARCK
ncbi:hypothetical protein [Rossellomorea marisflavi]|uniref:hypothetical protein n=1 Tax=Rossellomorea marisflavi TaxID=189381 RepID=UPI00345CC236